MYNVNPFPPPFGVCSICHQHTCGTSPDGEKWIQIPLELFIGGDIHIGYGCIKSMSDNLGIAQEVVEREVLLTPTVEQIGEYVRKAVNNMPKLTPAETWMLKTVEAMDRDELKIYLKAHDIDFVAQWGEQKLRDLAINHTNMV